MSLNNTSINIIIRDSLHETLQMTKIINNRPTCCRMFLVTCLIVLTAFLIINGMHLKMDRD